MRLGCSHYTQTSGHYCVWAESGRYIWIVGVKVHPGYIDFMLDKKL